MEENAHSVFCIVTIIDIVYSLCRYSFMMWELMKLQHSFYAHSVIIILILNNYFSLSKFGVLDMGRGKRCRIRGGDLMVSVVSVNNKR